MILTELIKIYKNVVKYDTKLGVHINGEDNCYPERVERIINNSISARQGATILQQFIVGKGVIELNDFIVNTKGTTMLQFLNEGGYSLSRQYGIFIHVNYNLEGDITYADVLPYSHCRVGKKDDNDYNGKILVSPDWKDKKITPRVFDVFNYNKEVVLKQIKRDGISKYKGQILFVNPTPFTYPLSKVDPVMLDADTEAQIAVFKNASLRKGFFGKQLIITRPFADGDVGTEEYANGITERDNFRNAMEDFMSVENTGSVMHLETELHNMDLDKEIIFKNIDSNINDKLFQHSEESVSDNIRMAFNNIPSALVRSKDGSLFGSGGEAINQMKLFYQDQTTHERMILEQALNTIARRFKGIERTLTITPLLNVNKQVDNT